MGRAGHLVGTACLMAVMVGGVLAVSHRALVPRPVPPPPSVGLVPDFSLLDQQGRRVSRAQLRGTTWIAGFIFTRCAGQCPLIIQRLTALTQRLSDEPALRFVCVSVDPAYDTPARLAQYAARIGATPPQWLWLTGEPEAVRALVQDGFRLAIGEEGGPDEPIIPPPVGRPQGPRPAWGGAAAGEPAGSGITHSVRLVLVDERGDIRGTYDATDRRAMERLEQTARRLARQPRHGAPQRSASSHEMRSISGTEPRKSRSDFSRQSEAWGDPSVASRRAGGRGVAPRGASDRSPGLVPFAWLRHAKPRGLARGAPPR